MHLRLSRRLCLSRWLCSCRRLFLVTFLLAAVVPGRAQGPDSEAVHYLLEIREPASHMIDVTMTLKEATGGDKKRTAGEGGLTRTVPFGKIPALKYCRL